MASFMWTRPTEVSDEPRDLEHVEADIRKAMAEHAAIQPRGFDSIKARESLHRKIDAWFDEYAMRLDVEAVTS